MITVEQLNAIPGRPALMLPWRRIPGTSPDFHFLECVGDGEDLSDEFQITLSWLEGQPPCTASLHCSLPDFGPGTPIWDEIVDYARAVHRHLRTLAQNKD